MQAGAAWLAPSRPDEPVDRNGRSTEAQDDEGGPEGPPLGSTAPERDV